MTTKRNPKCYNNTSQFSARQVKDFVGAVHKEVGNGWAWLTPRIQEALIAERALFVLSNQVSTTIPTDELHALLGAMLTEAGLRTPEGK